MLPAAAIPAPAEVAETDALVDAVTDANNKRYIGLVKKSGRPALQRKGERGGLFCSCDYDSVVKRQEVHSISYPSL